MKDTGARHTVAANMMGIPRSTLYDALVVANIPRHKPGAPKKHDYRDEDLAAAVDDVISETLSYGQAAETYKIPYHTIYKNVKKKQEETAAASYDDDGQQQASSPTIQLGPSPLKKRKKTEPVNKDEVEVDDDSDDDEVGITQV